MALLLLDEMWRDYANKYNKIETFSSLNAIRRSSIVSGIFDK